MKKRLDSVSWHQIQFRKCIQNACHQQYFYKKGKTNVSRISIFPIHLTPLLQRLKNVFGAL